jgi:hypothetical protein
LLLPITPLTASAALVGVLTPEGFEEFDPMVEELDGELDDL